MDKQLMKLAERLEKQKAQIGKRRDMLRTIIDDAEELDGCCEEAIEGIESAIEALSRYA